MYVYSAEERSEPEMKNWAVNLAWWCVPVIPALGRKKQENFHKLRPA